MVFLGVDALTMITLPILCVPSFEYELLLT